ncbi:MAG: hypothetical protein EU547_04310 [Promethearchaeota archaeon]|nr:MAG: hypothetical protein EU547_04310 [Candidatus Lokiarchaeota archaeon]
MFRKTKDKEYEDFDPTIISWNREDRGKNTNIMYIYPQLGEDFDKIKYFAVKAYERALFYDKGELIGILEGGVYELDKKAKTKGTEIVWIDISINEINWGIPLSNGIPSKNGIIVGLHGNLKFRVNDVKTFYNDVVAGKKIWSLKDVKDWTINLLRSVLRDVFKKYEAKQILLEDRERIFGMVNSKLVEDFMNYGLELESINVLGIQVPEGMESLYEDDKQKSVLSKEKEIMELEKVVQTKKRELEAAKKSYEREQKVLDAQSKLEEIKYISEAEKLSGFSSAEVLEKQKTAEVAGDVAKIRAGSKNQDEIKEEKFLSIDLKIKELNEKLNQLDDLLASGKMSEDVYKIRVKRVEKQIESLENKKLNI